LIVKVRHLLLAFLALLVGVEVTNFAGFSWARLRRIPDEELINVAIRYNYPNIYSDSDELKADYSSFKPEVYYWSDLTGEIGNQFWNKFFGLKLFQVRLPDAVVIVGSGGKALFSRSCGENRLCSPEVLPDHPVLGIVGTVQDGPPNYDVSNDFSVRWVDGYCIHFRPLLRGV
jgi:hypothetical protein